MLLIHPPTKFHLSSTNYYYYYYYYYYYILLWKRKLGAVGIATRYELDGPGIESRWRWDYPKPSRLALDPSSLPDNRDRVFPARKAAGRGVDHSATSRAEGKERVELHIYSPSGPSGLFLGELYLTKTKINIHAAVIFRRVRKIAKSDYWPRHVCPSDRPHGTRIPLDGFLRNLIFEDFSKIWHENSSLIKIWQE